MKVEDLCSVTEASKILGKTKQTVYKYAKLGYIKEFRFDHVVLYDKNTVIKCNETKCVKVSHYPCKVIFSCDQETFDKINDKSIKKGINRSSYCRKIISKYINKDKEEQS